MGRVEGSNNGDREMLKGFASMDREKRIEIARKGGRNVPKEKRAFSQNRELASSSGKKGGKLVPIHSRSYYKDRNLAAAAGRKGGLKSQENRRNKWKTIQTQA